MKRRVVLLTEIIAPYRIPVFNELAKHREIDLEVIFLAETDPSLRQWQIYKNEISFRYQVLRSWRKRFGLQNILLNAGLSAALEAAKPDAIVCGGYNYLASWQSLYWARQKSVRFLVWVESNARDRRSGDPAKEFLKRKFLCNSGGVIVPGKSSFEYVRGYSVPQKNIFIAPNAVDIELFACRAEEARRNQFAVREKLGLPQRYFLYVGRLVPEKGVFDLVEAYGTLSQDLRKKIGLLMVGDGAARDALVGMVPAGVGVHDFVQRDELGAFYALADALVFPTHSDPWGLVVNEAMACGLPIIASEAAGCVADLLEDGWNGRVVASKATHELALAMTTLATDDALRHAMGKRSRERIAGFSPQACAEGIVTAVLCAGECKHA